MQFLLVIASRRQAILEPKDQSGWAGSTTRRHLLYQAIANVGTTARVSLSTRAPCLGPWQRPWQQPSRGDSLEAELSCLSVEKA